MGETRDKNTCQQSIVQLEERDGRGLDQGSREEKCSSLESFQFIRLGFDLGLMVMSEGE